MSLSSALYNAYSGLRATSTRAEVASNNIANAETEGFARREVVQESVVLDGNGAGVRVVGIEIAAADVLTEDRWRADADAGYAREAAQNLNLLGSILGEVGQPGSIFERYGGLEEALRKAAGDPSSTSLLRDVVSRADDLAGAFNSAQAELTELRTDIDREIATTIDNVNATLVEISDLNKEIKALGGSGIMRNELVSQRNILIDAVSQIIPVKTLPRENGAVSLMTTSGYGLVGETAVTLEFSSVGLVTPEMDLIGGNPNGLSGLVISGQDVTPPAAAAKAIDSGQLAALFQARDVATVTLQNQLDAMSEDLLTRFSDPAVEPTLAPGGFGLFDLTAGAATDPGVAGAIRVNPTFVEVGATSEIDLTVNLDETVDHTLTPPPFTTAVKYFDAAGAAQTLTVEFTHTAADTWGVRIADTQTGLALTDLGADIVFHSTAAVPPNDVGSISSVAVTTGSATVGAGTSTLALSAPGVLTLTLDDGTNTQTIDLDLGAPNTLGNLTQLASASTPASLTGGSSPTVLRDGLDNPATAPVGDDDQLERLLAAMTNTRTPPTGSGVTGNRTASGLVSEIVAGLASESQRADQELATRSARREAAYTAEITAIGVDLDDELQDLTRIQTAYAANARVVQVIDQLFQTLLEI